MTPKPYRLIDEARADLFRHYDDLLLFSIERADQFRTEIEKGFAAIAAKPKHFGFVAGYLFRSYGPTKRHGFRIAYVETADEVIIVAIYYGGAADPLYWVGRSL